MDRLVRQTHRGVDILQSPPRTHTVWIESYLTDFKHHLEAFEFICPNRNHLLDGDFPAKFLGVVLALPKIPNLLSTDISSLDGTLIETWLSIRNVRPKNDVDGGSLSGGRHNGEADFHGLKRVGWDRVFKACTYTLFRLPSRQRRLLERCDERLFDQPHEPD